MLATELADDYAAVAKRERASKGGFAKAAKADDGSFCLETASTSKQKNTQSDTTRSRARAAKKMEVSERRVRESKKLKDKSPWLAEGWVR